MQAGGRAASCSGRLARFLLAAHAPMTSVLACEFHMLPKTCGWRGSRLEVIFRGVAFNQGNALWRSAALESNISLYAYLSTSRRSNEQLLAWLYATSTRAHMTSQQADRP